jgi:hypothetical protein
MYMTNGDDEKAIYEAVGGISYLTDLSIRITCLGKPQEQISEDPKLHPRFMGNIEINASLAETLFFLTLVKQSFSLQRLDVEFRGMRMGWRSYRARNWENSKR